MKWTKAEKALPVKPNDSECEQLDCWVIRKNRDSVEHLVWDFKYLWWNDNDDLGSGFNCNPLDVEYWMPMNIPTPPEKE